MQELLNEIRTVIDLALAEDRVDTDVTSQALVPDGARARARVVVKDSGRVCGLVLLAEGSPLLDAFPGIVAELQRSDGDPVAPGDVVAILEGPGSQLLGLERTLLNFMQRLSGIATRTVTFVEAVKGTRARIQETRKTCPGLRALDKYAVRCGGGLNHRMNLADQVLIKENHLMFSGSRGSSESITEAIRRARDHASDHMIVEVEVENLLQFDAALEAQPDVVMLDDFTDDDVRTAIARRDAAGPPPPLLEASGGVSCARAERLARLGVDRISVGALTHSVQALDLAMDLEILP